MLVRLQTADHIRLASTVQQAQRAPAAWDRTRIMRFPMCKKEDPLPWSSRAVGGAFFLGGLTIDYNTQVSLLSESTTRGAAFLNISALTPPGQVTTIPVANFNTVSAHRGCLWT
jgi:hypothetical protein